MSSLESSFYSMITLAIILIAGLPSCQKSNPEYPRLFRFDGIAYTQSGVFVVNPGHTLTMVSKVKEQPSNVYLDLFQGQSYIPLLEGATILEINLEDKNTAQFLDAAGGNGPVAKSIKYRQEGDLYYFGEQPLIFKFDQNEQTFSLCYEHFQAIPGKNPNQNKDLYFNACIKTCERYEDLDKNLSRKIDDLKYQVLDTLILSFPVLVYK